MFNYRIRKVTPEGIITTIAGTGTSGYSGDGGPAINAQLRSTKDVITDSTGNVYISDSSNSRIRKVTSDGIITTIAGGGTGGLGDGGPATSARLNYPRGLAIDSAGKIYIADAFNNRIRKLEYVETITTVASISDINVVNGTTLGSVNLPQSVNITLSDNSTTSAAVTWNSGSPVYNGSVVGTYTFTGTITPPAGVINLDNKPAAVKVVVEAPPVPATITAGKGLVKILTGKPQYANAKIPFVIDSQSFSKNPTGCSFDVIYDPTKVGTVTVDSFNGLTKPTIGTPLPAADSSKEKVTVSWSGTLAGDYTSSKGILFKLNFVAKQDFTSGETAIEIGTGSFTFPSGNSSITGISGKIISEIIYGDVNGDGAITSSDTNLINKYVSGRTTAIIGEAKLTAADVDGDGSITAADAKEISNYISGKESTLKSLFGY